MTSVEYAKDLVTRNFNVRNVEEIDAYQVSFVVEKQDVHQLLSMLKTHGWKQLSYVSAVDWIAENEFELVYIVMNWDKALHIQVRTRISRENPSMNSILPIFEGCKYYEREAHEFFGIRFPGNPDYEKQLILEDWDDIPPLRKDFDPRKYSDAHFAKREYSKDFVNLNNQESKQLKRQERTSFLSRLKGGTK